MKRYQRSAAPTQDNEGLTTVLSPRHVPVSALRLLAWAVQPQIRPSSLRSAPCPTRSLRLLYNRAPPAPVLCLLPANAYRPCSRRSRRGAALGRVAEPQVQQRPRRCRRSACPGQTSIWGNMPVACGSLHVLFHRLLTGRCMLRDERQGQAAAGGSRR